MPNWWDQTQGLAVGLNGPSSSGLRALPASLPWLHLSSLTVANVDIYLRFSPFSMLSMSPSHARDTEDSDGGSAVEAHSVWQRQYPGSIRSLNLDSNPDLLFKSGAFPLPQHSVYCGCLHCLAWSLAENEPFVDL